MRNTDIIDQSDIAVDNCAICKSHIMDLCMDCQANQGAESENGAHGGIIDSVVYGLTISSGCTVAWGICNVRLANQRHCQYIFGD